MDVGLLSSSHSGVNFMPASLAPSPNGVLAWPEDLNNSFMDYISKKKGCCLLTSRKATKKVEKKATKKVAKKALAVTRKKAPATMNKAGRKRKAVDTIDTSDGEVLGPRTRGRKSVRFSQEVDL
jgi:hypothetical protein